MESKNIEKKIYEFLGVNIFRKYVLFTYEKIWKLIGFKEKTIGYKIQDFSSRGLEKFKSNRKFLAKVHIFNFILINSLYGFTALTDNLSPLLLGMWLTGNLIDLYSIMTQRYNYIRLNEILKKREERQQKKENNNNSFERCNNIYLEQSHTTEQQFTDEKHSQEIIDLLRKTREELLLYTNNQTSIQGEKPLTIMQDNSEKQKKLRISKHY